MTQRTQTNVVVRLAAEFTVIVVGVLAAFSMEDWASDRADRLLEVQYLEALRADLRGDSALYADRLIPGLANREAALRSIWPIARGEAAVPVDTIGLLLDIAASHRTVFLDLGGETLQELLVTGSLRLVESQDLRSAIIAYYRSIDLAAARSDSRTSTYPDLVRSYLPERASRSAVSREDGEALLREFGRLQEAVAAIRTEEFQRAMSQHLNYLALMLPMLDDLSSELRALIPLVDSEVERLSQ